MVGYEDVTRKPSIFLLAHSQKEVRSTQQNQHCTLKTPSYGRLTLTSRSSNCFNTSFQKGVPVLHYEFYQHRLSRLVLPAMLGVSL